MSPLAEKLVALGAAYALGNVTMWFLGPRMMATALRYSLPTRKRMRDALDELDREDGGPG